MKKFLIISSIVVGLFVVTAFSYSRAKNSSQLPHNGLIPIAASPLPEPVEMVDSKDGVDISVDEVKRENGQTILAIGINNHVEDYSQVDLKVRSDLAGVKPIKYVVDDSASGGHHVSAELVFAGDLSGLLTIKLTDELVFNINVK